MEKRLAVQQVFEHTFPSGIDMPLVALRQRLQAIADALSLVAEEWDEDGLGRARGCFVRLETGPIILLREMEHEVERLGAEGPIVYVDAGDAAEQGLASLVAQIVAGLLLQRDQIGEVPDDAEAWHTEAVESVERAKRFRAERANRN